MKFGLHYDLRNPPGSRRRTPDLYRDTLRQIELAESLGFDDIWLSEHHFMEDGYLPSLLPFAGAVAARMERVNIGTNILLMPFHHPIRIAEDCAVVDLPGGHAGRDRRGTPAGTCRGAIRAVLLLSDLARRRRRDGHRPACGCSRRR